MCVGGGGELRGGRRWRWGAAYFLLSYYLRIFISLSLFCVCFCCCCCGVGVGGDGSGCGDGGGVCVCGVCVWGGYFSFFFCCARSILGEKGAAFLDVLLLLFCLHVCVFLAVSSSLLCLCLFLAAVVVAMGRGGG